MQKKKNFIPVFLILFILSILLFILASTGSLRGLVSFFENGTVSLQKTVFGFARRDNASQSEIEELRQENVKLATELAKKSNQDNEINALRDQFQTQRPASDKLMPASVIGTMTNRIIIDKGEVDSVRKGSVVVYKDNLIGRIGRTSQHVSVVDLTTSSSILLTAKSINSSSLGVIKGSDNGIILDHVTLSEKLNKGDLILTRGDIDESGSGFPPDLVVGKISTINKKASSLFQTAEVDSLVDFSKLETVFVITTNN
jgi:rod shape-determining protein MreC